MCTIHHAGDAGGEEGIRPLDMKDGGTSRACQGGNHKRLFAKDADAVSTRAFSLDLLQLLRAYPVAG